MLRHRDGFEVPVIENATVVVTINWATLVESLLESVRFGQAWRQLPVR